MCVMSYAIIMSDSSETIENDISNYSTVNASHTLCYIFNDFLLDKILKQKLYVILSVKYYQINYLHGQPVRRYLKHNFNCHRTLSPALLQLLWSMSRYYELTRQLSVYYVQQWPTWLQKRDTNVYKKFPVPYRINMSIAEFTRRSYWWL
jgi:hypothetical protein